MDRRPAAGPALVRLLPALLIVLALVLMPATALAANPPPYETYFVPLPDDWLMQHMEDLDTAAEPIVAMRTRLSGTSSASPSAPTAR